MSDTKVVLGVADDAFTYVTQVSSLSGLPPDQAIAAGVGFRVDNYLMMEAHALGQVIPTRYEQYAVPYKGALVIEPKMGLYENVALLDFSSMYPRLMVKYNISPDTLIPIHGDQRLGKIYQVPEVHHSFRASPPGFYTVALTKLLEIRKTTKFELKETSVNDPKYKLLRARDTATKITTNAVYGYAGWAGARWYSREVAESAAALGRDTIQHSIAIAEQLNLEVLYSDTDSLFVKYDEKLIAKFLKEIDSKFKLEISISQIYKRILFTEAKKKYAGLRRDGEIDIVGLEAIRGDWSLLAKNVQNDIVRIILEHKEPKDAVEYVSKLIRKLDRGDDDIPLSSFIIWKSLTRPVAKYEVNAPHVEAAKRMLKDGSPVSVGDKIGFIITNRGGRLYQKAEPYYKVKREQIDVNYYVRNQIIPAAARITEIFGYTEEKLIEIAESSQQENVLSKH
jgi:DNA polymerase I